MFANADASSVRRAIKLKQIEVTKHEAKVREQRMYVREFKRCMQDMVNR
jgi:hypothetical protein